MIIQQNLSPTQEIIYSLLTNKNVITPSLMLTLKLSVKRHPPKLTYKCCLQNSLSAALSCNSAIRSGPFFLGGRFSCDQEDGGEIMNGS